MSAEIPATKTTTWFFRVNSLTVSGFFNDGRCTSPFNLNDK